MDEQINIYFAPGESVYWCQRGSAQIKQGHLHDALDDVGDNDIVVVLPGESVLLTQVELPPIRQATRRLQATRYALEESLASPVERLHFSLAPRQADGVMPVAIVDNETLDEYLADFGPARKQITAVLIDSLCLPLSQNGDCSLRLIEDRALVRSGLYQGFACELALLSTLLSAAQFKNAQLNIAAPDSPQHQTLVDALAHEGYVVARANEASEYAWLAEVTPQTGINLMQAAYAPNSAMDEAWRPLRATAVLAGVWLVLALATHTVKYFQLSDRITTLDQQAEATFRKAFPQVQTINDIRVQAEQNLVALRGSGGTSGIFPLLGATAVATGAAPGLEVQSLQYRDGALSLSLRGKDIQALEGLRSSFGKQPNAELEVESADAASEGVQIRARVTGAGA